MATFSAKLKKVLDEADVKMATQIRVNQKWGIADFADWGLDQDSGLLSFTNPDGTGICAPALIVGHRRLVDSSWLWSWANPSFDEELTTAARDVVEYARSNGFEELCQPRLIDITEDDAWQIAALAAETADLSGTYRGPFNDKHIFIAYGSIQPYPVK